MLTGSGLLVDDAALGVDSVLDAALVGCAVLTGSGLATGAAAGAAVGAGFGALGVDFGVGALGAFGAGTTRRVVGRGFGFGVGVDFRALRFFGFGVLVLVDAAVSGCSCSRCAARYRAARSRELARFAATFAAASARRCAAVFCPPPPGHLRPPSQIALHIVPLYTGRTSDLRLSRNTRRWEGCAVLCAVLAGVFRLCRTGGALVW